MAHDGIFTDDAAEAIDALDQQIFGKKLMGRAGLELRPVPDRGMGTGGLARMSAAQSTNVTTIWRAFILKPRGRVAFVPPQGTSSADAGARLSAAGVVGPDGQATAGAYEYHFDKDTPTPRLVEFALSSLKSLGYGQGNAMWSWVTRAKDQVPR